MKCILIFNSYFSKHFPTAEDTQTMLGYEAFSFQPSTWNVKINRGFFSLYFTSCWRNTELWKIGPSQSLLINLLTCHMFSRFPDYSLIIKLYVSHFSNLWNTRKHINRHKPQGSSLSLKSRLSCWDGGSPMPGSPSGPWVLLPSSLWHWVFPLLSLRLNLDSGSLFLFLFSPLTPLPRKHTHMLSKGRACLWNQGFDTHPIKEKVTFRTLLLLKIRNSLWDASLCQDLTREVGRWPTGSQASEDIARNRGHRPLEQPPQALSKPCELESHCPGHPILLKREY